MKYCVRVCAFLLLFGSVAGLAASGKKEKSGPAGVEVEHELGKTLIEGVPERVVVLEFSFIDALASVGMAPVGIADDNKRSRVIPPIAKVIGDEWVSVGTRAQPNLEVLLSLNPDLIIADKKRHEAIYGDLSAIAPTIVLASLKASYEENLESMKVIGKALHKEKAVEKRLQEHRKRMKKLASRVPKDEARKFMTAVVWDEGFNAHTSSSYTGGVLEATGLKSALVSENPYSELNLEGVAEANPDILFLMKYGDRTIVDEWADNPLWKNISAVKNGLVFEMEPNLWARFRGIMAAEEITEDALDALYGKKN